MPRTAVLLLDLQVDFLDEQRGKMPVDPAGAHRVIEAANAVLRGELLEGALPVLVVNRFSPTATVANFFRHSAGLEGSAGAALDPRIATTSAVRTFPKRQASAFSNADLEPYLRSEGVASVWVLGVFAEGCVRATALDAKRRGFKVIVPQAEIATNASWKATYAVWALKRAGVAVVAGAREAQSAT